MRLLCILCRFYNLVWRAPIPFLSSFRKHRYLFQGPNSTKRILASHLWTSDHSHLKEYVWFVTRKDYEIQCKHLGIVLLLQPIYSQLFEWVILRPSTLRFTNYSYIQIETSKNRLKSQVSHVKVQKPIHLEISRNEAKLTPLPCDVPQVHWL